MCRRYLVVSDVDGTLLGDPSALLQLQHWLAQQPVEINWVYTSGRFFESVRNSVNQHGLPQPIVIIGGVGTEIVPLTTGRPLRVWRDQMGARFSASKIRKLLSQCPQLELQPEEFQSRFKVSYYWRNASLEDLQQIADQLARLAMEVQIIYSSQRDLDLLPASANKGNSAKFLAQYWNYPAEQVIVAGDSGNDLAMFQAGFRGIVVGNAAPEMRSLSADWVFQASASFAAGVMQGLNHWLTLDRLFQEHNFDNATSTV